VLRHLVFPPRVLRCHVMTELSFPEPPLTDGVVRLRAWTEADLPAKLAAFTDPLIDRFSNPRAAKVTDADVHASLKRNEQDRLHGESIDFAVCTEREPAAIAGGASVFDVDLGQGRASVGYWLTPAARGLGLATRATRLLAEWAFTDLGAARVELTCAPDNEASQRVALRCGFVREGVLRSHVPFKGGRRDTMIFSLLPSDLGLLVGDD
jgi:RimJ/RimL family protein N-acetyltransferase